MQPKAEPVDFEHQASQFRKKFFIGLFAIFVLYLSYYVTFSSKAVFPNLVKMFILVSIGVIFYLFKKLKAEPAKVKSAFGRTSQGPSAAKDLSLLNMQDLGFSENTINKARKLLQENVTELSLFSGKGRQAGFSEKQGVTADFKPALRETKPVDSSRNDKSIFDHISFDWPSNLSSSRMRAQQTKPFQSNYQDTKINENGAYYGNLQGKGALASMRRGPSNDGLLKRAESRPSQSKAKYTLQKNSITSKSDLRRETVPQYDKITESDMALQSILMSMGVNLEKFNVWAFHNIQVWLAFNFIPELLDRNMVC
jgi:hypothetical protein